MEYESIEIKLTIQKHSNLQGRMLTSKSQKRGTETSVQLFMVMSCHQHVEQKHNLLTANKSTENVTTFIYLEAAVTNQIAFTIKLQAA